MVLLVCTIRYNGFSLRKKRLPGMIYQRHHYPRDYFSSNTAFTWAVTVTLWGENSSVGVGAAAFAAMAMGRGGPTTRTFSNVSTEA